MDKLRYKQAQELILKSNKKTKNTRLKEAESGVIDIKLHEDALKKLIECEEFVYTSLPTHELTKKEAIKYTQILIKIRENINQQLTNFKVIEEEVEEIDLNKLTSEILFITTKNNFKKILKKIGIDVKNIVVADMPLVIEDMKKINPQIPEPALKGIEVKIKHIHNDINKKIEILKPSKIIVLGEKDINGELLSKRSKELFNAESYLTDDFKKITENDIIKEVF